MKNLRNRVQLIGNLGMDPEVRTFENGNKIAKFSLATNQVYTDNKGEKVEDTQWHNIVAWGKDAELAEKYFTKGLFITLEGKLTYRDYTDKQGAKRYMTEIVMQDVVLHSKK